MSRCMKKLFSVLLILLVISTASNALSKILVPAVTDNGNGVLAEITLEKISKPGIEVDISKISYGREVLNSIRTALEVGKKTANASNYSGGFRLEIASDAGDVDGPSAGVAFALLSYSELTGLKLRQDLSVTGGITESGTVTKIGGVNEKSKVVFEKGANIFLVPPEQYDEVYEIPQGKQVLEIKTLDQAIAYAVTKANERINASPRVEVERVKIYKFNSTPRTRPFEKVSNNLIGKLKNALAALESKLSLERFTGQQKQQMQRIVAFSKNAINMSGYLNENEYFYSAANNAFLAFLTVESFSKTFENKSKEAEIRSFLEKLEKLKGRMKSIKLPEKNENNFEWIVGGEMRTYWARDRLQQVDSEIKSNVTSWANLAAIEEWQNAALEMAEIGNGIPGKVLNEANSRDLASQLIAKMQTMLAKVPADAEMSQHNRTAFIAFKDAAYHAAIFDSAFVIGYINANERMHKAAEKGEESGSIVTLLKLNASQNFASLWAELYYAQSQYNFQEFNHTGNPEFLLNAVRLQSLSEELDSLMEMILQNRQLAGNPLVNAINIPPEPVTTTREEKPELKLDITATPSKNNLRDAILFSFAGAVLVILVVLLLYHPRHRAAIKAPKEKLGLAEGLLLDRRISEKTFLHLKKKYESEAREKVKRR